MAGVSNGDNFTEEVSQRWFGHSPSSLISSLDLQFVAEAFNRLPAQSLNHGLEADATIRLIQGRTIRIEGMRDLLFGGITAVKMI